MNEKQILQIKKRFFLAAVVLLGILAVWKLNDISKTQLVNRTGQTFETGVVVRILEDNIQEDGTRVGQQTVVVRMTSGVKKGQEFTTTSSAGYLFGAACQGRNAGGDSPERRRRFRNHKRIFHGPKRGYDRICPAVSGGSVHRRGQEGGQRSPGSCPLPLVRSFTFICRPSIWAARRFGLLYGSARLLRWSPCI